MAKIYGLFGSMTGKVADVVMSIRYGEQLVRKYQPIVSNPQTAAQIAQRAKLKLASQLSAVMGPYIAMPREGSRSSRNLFVKKNYPALTYAANTADVELINIQLTNSVVGLPGLSVSGESYQKSVALDAQANTDLSRVVYVAFSRQEDGKLRYVNSAVVSTPGADNRFATTMDVNTITEPVVIYAYGVRDNTDSARVKFGDLEATAAAVANLIVTRVMTENDITITETQAIQIPVANRENPENSEEKKTKKN